MRDETKQQMLDHLPRLRRFAYALAGDRDRGDDLVQDTLVRALTYIDQWQEGTRLDSWMFKIAQNLWFDRARVSAVRGETADIESVPEIIASDGREVTESRLTLDVVMKGIAQLPDNQRALVALVCVDGLSYKEAASVLDIPIGTVMSRLARARQHLLACIEGSTREQQTAMAERRNG